MDMFSKTRTENNGEMGYLGRQSKYVKRVSTEYRNRHNASSAGLVHKSNALCKVRSAQRQTGISAGKESHRCARMIGKS